MASGPIAVQPAEFIHDVPEYLHGRPVDQVLQQLSKDLQVYQLLEQELTQKKARTLYKIPEIDKSLKAVELLLQRRDEDESATFDFSLAEGVFAKASVKKVKSVNLWLGASVMLEYNLDEAKTLLEHNGKKAREQLDFFNKDLDTIKDFITTTQVNQARIYNHDVVARRSNKTSTS